MVVIANNRLRALALEGQLAGLELAAVAILEHPEQDLAFHGPDGGLPVDVEVAGVRAGATAPQDVPPPRARAPRGRHVVRHYVDHDADVAIQQCGHQAPKPRLAAEL